MATKLELDKDAFFEMLGYRPHPGQLQVHRSKANRRVLVAGVRTGKSLCAAFEAVAAAMEPRKRSIGWCVAPTLDLADRVFREIVILVAEHLKHRIVKLKEHEKRLVLRNLGGGLSEIRGKTADNPVSLLGEGLDWLIIDEAARTKPQVWQQYLSQRLIDKSGWALIITTPKSKGWVFELWKRGQPGGDPDYESWQMPSWTNPHLKRELIEAERARLPEAVFRQEYEAAWVEGAGAVFRFVRDAATGDWEDPVPGKQYVAGLDLAQIVDFSVLVIMSRDRRVVHVERFQRMPWDAQVARFKAATDRYNHCQVLVDASGVGSPIVENLSKAGVRARPYKFTQTSKTELIQNLSVMLEKRQIVLPRADLCPELVDELEAFQYVVSDAGTIRMEAPGGMHDDLVVGLGLASWQCRRDQAPMRVVWV